MGGRSTTWRWPISAVAPLLLAVVLPASSATAAVPAERCDPETYMWTGSIVVSETDVVDTGVVVEPRLGSTLRIIGTSADGLDSSGRATAVPVSVGDAAAVVGELTAGGTIRLRGVGPSLTVSGATVVVDRCVLVASAPSPVIPAAELPATGSRAALLATIAALAAGAGAALAWVSRRPTAGGRARGSQRAAAPPPPR